MTAPETCGEIAATELDELVMTVREKGVVYSVPLNAIFNPLGEEAKLSTVVRGSTRSDCVAESPWESVAVSRIMSQLGYS